MGRRRVISSFKLFLPAFLSVEEGGVGVGTLLVGFSQDFSIIFHSALKSGKILILQTPFSEIFFRVIQTLEKCTNEFFVSTSL